MPLNAAQSAAKTIFTTSSGPNFTFQGETHHINEWYALGADNACIDYLNSQAVGAAQGKSVARASIDGNRIVDAIIASDEFPSMQPATVTQLQFAVSRSPFTFGDDAVAGVEGILQPFENALARFRALKTRPSSIWEALAVTDGASFTQDDMTAIRSS